MKSTSAKPRKAASVKTASPGGEPAQAVSNVEKVRQLIATAAYYRAQQRGFAAGHEQEDWLMAEQEINLSLSV